MRKIRVPQNSFSFGEISRSVMSRTDIPVYAASVQTLTNAYMLSGGGIRRRPGHTRIYDYNITKDTSKTFQARLLPFVFSDDEQYIVSIEDGRVRVFYFDQDNDTLSLSANLTTDVDANDLPFDADFIHQYTFAQSGDVMFICHPLFMPRQIVRTGLESFEVQVFAFDERYDENLTYQPYTAFHPNTVTLDPEATSGTNVRVTTSEAYFDTTGTSNGTNYPDSKHVGIKLRIYDTEMEITSVLSATQARVTILDEIKKKLEILNPFRSFRDSQKIEVTHLNHGFSGGESITIEDSNKPSGIDLNRINTSHTIDSIVDDNTYTILVGQNANDSEDFGGRPTIVTHAATPEWAEQSISELRGYPAAICFHEGRLVFGGTTQQPDGLWFSRTGRFYNFDTGDASDDDAISLTSSASQVHEIRYMVSSRDLQIFAASAELYMPSYLNESLTPTNAQLRVQTPYGCDFVSPALLDGGSLFAQNGKAAVREYIFTDSENAYVSTDVSTIASDLMGDVNDSAVCHGLWSNNESFALFTRDNRDAIMFTSNRGERRAGWSRIESPGEIHSMVALGDRLFGAVWHTVGDEVLILGEFKVGRRLDCSKLYDAPGGVITFGGDIGNNISVDVVAGGKHIGTYQVSGGQIDVSGETVLTEVEVGFGYYGYIEPNPADASMADGPVTGSPRGISSLILDLEDTCHLTIGGKVFDKATPFTGKKEFYNLGYSRDPQVIIGQNKPEDFQINGMIMELII